MIQNSKQNIGLFDNNVRYIRALYACFGLLLIIASSPLFAQEDSTEEEVEKIARAINDKKPLGLFVGLVPNSDGFFDNKAGLAVNYSIFQTNARLYTNWQNNVNKFFTDTRIEGEVGYGFKFLKKYLDGPYPIVTVSYLLNATSILAENPTDDQSINKNQYRVGVIMKMGEF